MRLIVLVFFSLAWQVNNASAESLREVLSRHMQARGGSETLEKANIIYLRMVIYLPSGKKETISWATRDRKVRINEAKPNTNTHKSIVINGDLGYEIITENYPVVRKAPEKRKLTKAETAEYWTQAFWPLIGANEFNSLYGYKLHLLGKKKLEGGTYWVIRANATHKTPTSYVSEVHLFIDSETYLLSHTKSKTGEGGREMEYHFSDFQFLGPIVIPLKSESIDAMTKIVRRMHKIRHAKLNPDIESGRFDPNVPR